MLLAQMPWCRMFEPIVFIQFFSSLSTVLYIVILEGKPYGMPLLYLGSSIMVNFDVILHI